MKLYLLWCFRDDFRVNLGFSAVVLQYNNATGLFIITITITILYTFLYKSTPHLLFKFLITRIDFWPKNFRLIYWTQMKKVELNLDKKVNQHCCRAPPNSLVFTWIIKMEKVKYIYKKNSPQQFNQIGIMLRSQINFKFSNLSAQYSFKATNV